MTTTTHSPAREVLGLPGLNDLTNVSYDLPTGQPQVIGRIPIEVPTGGTQFSFKAITDLYQHFPTGSEENLNFRGQINYDSIMGEAYRHIFSGHREPCLVPVDLEERKMADWKEEKGKEALNVSLLEEMQKSGFL